MFESPLIIPVWVGPAQMIVLSKGRAYSLGLLAVSKGHIALESPAKKFDLSTEEVTIEWPRLLVGAGIWVTWPDGKCAICFGKPFPDAPTLTESGLTQAAIGLRTLSAIPNMPGNLALGSGLLSALVSTAAAYKTMQAGRTVGDRVRSILS